MTGIWEWWSNLGVWHAEFAIVDEAYPYVAKMLLTDDSPRLRASLKYMVSQQLCALACQSHHLCMIA